MKKTLEIIKGMAITATIIAVCFVLCLVIQYIFDDTSLVPAIFVLEVFLTSVITKGYIYGIVATVISVMAVNFAFTFPLFAFDFTIPENIISALILFLVSIITCSLTIKIKMQEMIKAESEYEKNLEQSPDKRIISSMNWALDTECVNVMNKIKYKIRIL